MQDVLQLRDLRAIRALGHPTRLRILDLLAEAPATNRQLAERLHQSPSRVFFHVRQLLDAGLIRRGETRVVGGVAEKYYEPVARRYLIDRRTRDRSREPRAGAVLADAWADYEAALAAFGPTGADYDAARLTARLRPADVERARAAIWSLLDELRGLERPDGQAFSLTWLMHPRAPGP
jgi:DNA-binding transcriptional ArsR family regulator